MTVKLLFCLIQLPPQSVNNSAINVALLGCTEVVDPNGTQVSFQPIALCACFHFSLHPSHRDFSRKHAHLALRQPPGTDRRNAADQGGVM